MSDNLGLIFCVGIIITALALMGVLVVANGKENDRLIMQCMDDGRKEYECRAMLRDQSPTVIPIPVYVR